MDIIAVGIDVSKDRLDVAVRPSGEAFAVERNGAGIDGLIERLRALAPTVVAIEATGGFQRHKLRTELPQTDDQCVKAGRLALNRKRLATRTHRDVQPICRYVDTNDDGFHGHPSLPNRASRFAAQATVRVRWNDGRRTKLSHGLDHPRDMRSSARHRTGYLSR